MKVFIANFGIKNALWPRCREQFVALTYSDDDESWPLLQAGDREGFIAFTVENKKTARGIAVTRPVTSRWFNLLQEVTDSAGDLWIHRDKDDLWWTISLDQPARTLRIPNPWSAPSSAFVHLVEKPTEPWRNTSRTGARLLWAGLHPRAKQFLFTEGTLQQPSPSNAEYAQALVAGEDLSRWHALPEWKAVADRVGHGDTRTFESWEKAALRMALTAEQTAKGSLRDPRPGTQKIKKFLFRSVHDMAEYLQALLEAQGYTCALSGLPLQADGDVQDREFAASLDRIDSSGHYEPENLQVVCQFINRWKSDDTDANFQRLLEIVRGGPGRRIRVMAKIMDR